MDNAKEIFLSWLREVKDPQLANELESLKESPQKIFDKFSSSLCFGTGGLRGKIGAGTNCMNIYTVSRISVAVAKWSKQTGGKKVVISYDSRKNSLLFAKTAAEVFAAAGFFVFITSDVMPTPFLSFAARFLSCDLGVMITASHNPPEYNGYKVYSGSGCQLADLEAQQIADILTDLPYFNLPEENFDRLVKENKIGYVQDEVAGKYLTNVLSLKNCGISTITAAYSALNGAGYKLVPQLLNLAEIGQLYEVEEQCRLDENFPSCKEPNPEKPAAFSLAVKCAQENHCDIAFLTDPDADRIGVAVREENGGYAILNGNETALIILDFLLSCSARPGLVVITTMVSSPLILEIAAKHKAKVMITPTGFKYIGKKIQQLENDGVLETFLCGLEESHGYLAGTFVRDKDAIISAYLLCQAAAELKTENKTMIKRLNELYAEFGYIENKLLTYKFEGVEGKLKMHDRLAGLKSGGIFASVSMDMRLTDYQTSPLEGFEPFNALRFELNGGIAVIIRPSGTEPLLKAYVSVKDSEIRAKEKAAKIQNLLDKFFR